MVGNLFRYTYKVFFQCTFEWIELGVTRLKKKDRNYQKGYYKSFAFRIFREVGRKKC
jgi:hypothetical protein